MSKKVTTDEVLAAIAQEIEAREKTAQYAMLVMEQMNTNKNDYRGANIQFARNQYVAAYLKHIYSALQGADLKVAESLIRFHAYYLDTKGVDANNDHYIAPYMATVVMILNDYISKYFA